MLYDDRTSPDSDGEARTAPGEDCEEGRSTSNRASEVPDVNITTHSVTEAAEAAEPHNAPAYDGSYGIDKIRVFYKLNDVGNFNTRGFASERKIPDVGFDLRLRVEMPLLNQPSAVFEFNPSRYEDPDGSTLCKPDDTCELVLGIVAALGSHGLEPSSADLSDYQIRRCDITRDFRVEDATAWIAASKGTWAKNASGQCVWVNKDASETSMASKYSGLNLILYDKTRTHGTDAWTRERSLRFEAQMRSKSAKKLGVGTLDRLTNEQVIKTGQALWKKSNHGKVLLARSAAQIIAATDVSPHERAQLLGAYHAKRGGVNLGLTTRDPMYKHLAELKLLTHKRTIKKQTTGLRLDWALGTEVFTG